MVGVSVTPSIGSASSVRQQGVGVADLRQGGVEVAGTSPSRRSRKSSVSGVVSRGG